MASLSDLAYARNRQLIAQGELLRRRVARLWREIPLNDLSAGFARVAPGLTATVTAAQLAAARSSEAYMSAVDRKWGSSTEIAPIVPEAFAGVAGDGRELAPGMYGAVTHTKTLIGRGAAAEVAFQSGATYLMMIAQGMFHDMARNADRVSATGHKYTSYIRVVNGSACSRCAILAGRYSAEEAFLRHVSCQCGTVPVSRDGKAPSGLHDSPQAYFDSLSRAEQDRVFTKAGAEAIRSGADPVKVVNARRGAYGIGYTNGAKSAVGSVRHMQKTTIGFRPNGDPVQVYATTEGVTSRGAFGKAETGRAGTVKLANDRYSKTERVRLMPEDIFRFAGADERLRLAFLRDAGYIEYRPSQYSDTGRMLQEIRDLRAADRVLVNRATLARGNFTLG